MENNFLFLYDIQDNKSTKPQQTQKWCLCS